jgi:hypothetical protein
VLPTRHTLPAKVGTIFTGRSVRSFSIVRLRTDSHGVRFCLLLEGYISDIHIIRISMNIFTGFLDSFNTPSVSCLVNDGLNAVNVRSQD